MTHKKEYSPQVVIADAVGITHLLLGTLAILLGEVTNLFSGIDVKHGGVKFIFYFLDAPIYLLLKPHLPATEGNSLYMLVAGVSVLVLASIAYAGLAYVIVRFAASLFRSDE